MSSDHCDCAGFTGRLSIYFAVVALVCAEVLAGCDRSSSTTRSRSQPHQDQYVAVYSSVDDVYAREVAEVFTRETGIQVNLVPDSEETKSTGLLNRLIAEKARPRADVFWSGDPVRAVILKSEGISEPYRPAGVAAVPRPEIGTKEGDDLTLFSARVRVIIFNRKLLAGGSKPTSIFDLLDPRFASKACLANPLFGTTSMHAAAIFESLGDAKGREFFEGLSRNGVKMLSSNGEVRRRVAAGDFLIGLTDSDDASVALRDGQPIDFVLPDQEGIGTLLIPNAAVLIAKGPNPEGGRKFIDFITSEKAERMLAESDAVQIPLQHDLPTPGIFGRPLSQMRLIKVDYGRLGSKLQALQDGFLKEWAERQNK